MKTIIITTPSGAIIKNLLETKTATSDAVEARMRRAAKKLECGSDDFVMIGGTCPVHTTWGSVAHKVRSARTATYGRSDRKPLPVERKVQSRCLSFCHAQAGKKPFLPKGWTKQVKASAYTKARAFGLFRLLSGPQGVLP